MAGLAPERASSGRGTTKMEGVSWWTLYSGKTW